jgi:hypothetical protein
MWRAPRPVSSFFRNRPTHTCSECVTIVIALTKFVHGAWLCAPWCQSASVPARQALAYARAIAPDDAHVVAVHVTDDVAAAEGIRRQWEEWEPGVELVIIPELVGSRWWEHLLHNQTQGHMFCSPATTTPTSSSSGSI